jgi:hypothetical protein
MSVTTMSTTGVSGSASRAEDAVVTRAPEYLSASASACGPPCALRGRVARARRPAGQAAQLLVGRNEFRLDQWVCVACKRLESLLVSEKPRS